QPSVSKLFWIISGRVDQKIYLHLRHLADALIQSDLQIGDLSTKVRGQLASMEVHRTEVKTQVDNVAKRVERAEREVEYLENKTPNQPHIEVEEALMEEQMKDAQKKKVKITLGTDCNITLIGVKSLMIVKKAGDGSAKIYFFSGNKNNTVLEFKSLKTFTEGRHAQAHPIQLPFPWQGTGHVVYNGFLYYHRADTPNQILKVHLLNRTVADSMLQAGVELGLWVIYSDPEFGGNLVITKLDKSSLAVEHTWDTTCTSRDAESALMICGTLYAVYNSCCGGRSSIQCLYDIHDPIHSEESPVLFFPKHYTNHYSMHYHPKDKQLYACYCYTWDDGYQTIYKVDLKSKAEV
uniref:Olfactomedin like 1 n=1 Tax=Salmo trutta TaxID=8032 RepID=A0A673YEN7_SALTR